MGKPKKMSVIFNKIDIKKMTKIFYSILNLINKYHQIYRKL